MSNQQILEKAIQKAIDGGFDYRGFKHFKVYLPDLNWIEFNHGSGIATHASVEPFTLIFNHDFAKALWGEAIQAEGFVVDGNPVIGRPLWQVHSRNMVIADDPIVYLGNAI